MIAQPVTRSAAIVPGRADADSLRNVDLNRRTVNLNILPLTTFRRLEGGEREDECWLVEVVHLEQALDELVSMSQEGQV